MTKRRSGPASEFNETRVDEAVRSMIAAGGKPDNLSVQEFIRVKYALGKSSPRASLAPIIEEVLARIEEERRLDLISSLPEAAIVEYDKSTVERRERDLFAIAVALDAGRRGTARALEDAKESVRRAHEARDAAARDAAVSKNAVVEKENLLKERDEAIARLMTDLKKREEEIAQLKARVDEQERSRDANLESIVAKAVAVALSGRGVQKSTTINKRSG